MMLKRALIGLGFAAFAHAVHAPVLRAQTCTDCAIWNAPHAPLRLFGNTYYVGTDGLSAVLVTSDKGHVLIDGGLAMSAPLIEANIKALGFRVEDVKVILNSHAHYDHAGGIAELQRASGARVIVSAASARELAIGNTTADDPQLGLGVPYPRVEHVETVREGDTVRVGPLALVAHWTAGHTPGGTTWTWRSCEAGKCLDMVYADSQTPVSSDGFSFAHSTAYPHAVQDFEHGEAVLEGLRCDVLITPHPGASRLWERVAAGELVDREACKKYAAAGRAQLKERLARESSSRP